jgi:hypothetical protein
MAPRTWNSRFTRTEQGEQEQGRAGTTSQAPPLPSIPAPVAQQLGDRNDQSSWESRGRALSPSGTIVWPRCASHHHATCTPAIIPCPALCYTTLRVRHALDLIGTIAVDLVLWTWSLHYPRQTQQLHQTGTTNRGCGFPSASLSSFHGQQLTFKYMHALLVPWCPSGCEQHALRRRASGSPSISWGSWAEALLRWKSRLNRACTNSQSAGACASLLRHQLLCHTRAACQCEWRKMTIVCFYSTSLRKDVT